MSVDWIQRNVKVFSKDLSLTLAQKVAGVRAVFGEAYPDPVRVVSLEYDVDEIAQDIENPKWRSTSIEFCGGTHVARTGDIKDFVITEESGIAKGIRRIVAVTGHEAQDVTRVADAFEARIKQVEQLTGKAKDTALKTLSVVRDTSNSRVEAKQCGLQELGQTDTSLLRKLDMRERLMALRKALDKETKERETAANKTVRDVYTRLPPSTNRAVFRLFRLLWPFSTRIRKLKHTLQLSMSRATQRYLERRRGNSC